MRPATLIELAFQCRLIWRRAKTQDADLWGLSILDLMADNLTTVSLEDLKAAIIAAGIYVEANARIKAQIARF